MGEIGLPRREYLYELDYCDMLLIARGYFRRNREMWSATRWQTFNLMCCSQADLKKAGIYRPTDLIHFPWEKDKPDDDGGEVTKEEYEQMQRMMREENEKLAKLQQDINNK